MRTLAIAAAMYLFDWPFAELLVFHPVAAGGLGPVMHHHPEGGCATGGAARLPHGNTLPCSAPAERPDPPASTTGRDLHNAPGPARHAETIHSKNRTACRTTQ